MVALAASPVAVSSHAVAVVVLWVVAVVLLHRRLEQPRAQSSIFHPFCRCWPLLLGIPSPSRIWPITERLTALFMCIVPALQRLSQKLPVPLRQKSGRLHFHSTAPKYPLHSEFLLVGISLYRMYPFGTVFQVRLFVFLMCMFSISSFRKWHIRRGQPRIGKRILRNISVRAFRLVGGCEYLKGVYTAVHSWEDLVSGGGNQNRTRSG